MESFNQIRSFFESVKRTSFWQRLFSWSSIRSMAFDAWEEFVQLSELLRKVTDEKNLVVSENQLLSQEKVSLHRQTEELKVNLVKMETQAQANVQRLDTELKQTVQHLREKETAVSRYEQKQAQQEADYQLRLSKALSMQEMFEKKTNELHNERLMELEERQEKQRRTWADHETSVERAIRRICGLRGIDYVTEFPFRGKPDNAIQVAGETIIFDAKSPAGDDLGNFKSYIKQQGEAAKKYADHETVRKDIYLVVPTNAVEVLDTLRFDLGTYRVYVITLDALEPVMLTLKQLETYDFVDQISPEDRESICCIIGSLIYASKRKIQVDQFFNGHLLDLISKVQRELPDSMSDEIGKKEKAMKLNAPTDKRSKEINADVLLKTHHRVASLAQALDAPTPSMIELFNQ